MSFTFFSSSGMQIYIKFLNGKTITLMLKPSDTITIVKKKIQDHEKIQANQQRVVLKGKELEDSCTLAYYNITEQSTFHIVLKLMLSS